MSKTELKLLQKRIRAANIPKRKRNNFRLLTWNIRNFHGRKESKAMLFIAKIIKNFDVIAIQEVKDDLGE